MTEKPNFFKLGIFILIALALIVGGLVLFGSGAFGKKKIYLETYFSESIHGLTRGSDVLLSGVKIGVVEDVTFVSKSYDLSLDDAGISKYGQYIRVICSALEEKLPTPQVGERQQRLQAYVQRGFRLRMASNIITGQAYLEGVLLDPERFVAMEVPWKSQYDYIPSAPSAFTTMQASVDKILDKLEQIEFKTIGDNLNRVLETINQAVLDANVKDLSTKGSAFIEELRQSNKDLQKLIESPDAEKELDNIPVFIDNLNQTLVRLDQLVAGETPEIQEIMENIRQLSENLNYLTEHLKDNPSELLFSVPPPKPEK
jgi:phospholipid/cholesterol/gamma-HCH transport system substrate-binding protein/paraquat-inducible protein B